MATYKNLFKWVTVWQLNSDYEKIYNCIVIEPTYEKWKWLHNEEVMLDKRLWMELYHKHTDEYFKNWITEDEFWNLFDQHYTDEIVIDWYKYYLFHSKYVEVDEEDDNGKKKILANHINRDWTFKWFWYVWVWEDTWDWTWIKKIYGRFHMNEKTPLKFAKWLWAKWNRILWANITNWEVVDKNNIILNQNDIYEDWYIAIEINWDMSKVEPWQYIYFENNIYTQDNIYAWHTAKIEIIEWNKIFILWINKEGSLPKQNDYIEIYDDYWEIPVIWTEFWLIALKINKDKEIFLNATKNIYEFKNWHYWYPEWVILGWDIEDVVNFNWCLFALKDNVVYYSSQTFYDNLQFYSSRDRKRISWAYKLVPFWNTLIVFADDNRVISPINQVTDSDYYNYAFYPLNYHWKLYSKYSYVCINNALYIFQNDKKFFNLNISNTNTTNFEVVLEEIWTTVKWLFSEVRNYIYDEENNKSLYNYNYLNSIDKEIYIWNNYALYKWEIFMNIDYNSNVIHIFYLEYEWVIENNILQYLRIKENTVEFEYDNSYKHWLLNKYEYVVYQKTDQYLCMNYVNNIWWFTDLDKEYKQEINYFIYNYWSVIQFWFVDMMMWLIKWEKLLYNLDVEIESLRARKWKHKEIKDLTFDTLPSDHSLSTDVNMTNWKWIPKEVKIYKPKYEDNKSLTDDTRIDLKILNSLNKWFEIEYIGRNQHYWNIASIRRFIMESWRMFRVSINWYKRFIYWSSNIVYKEWNPFVHEIENSF